MHRGMAMLAYPAFVLIHEKVRLNFPHASEGMFGEEITDSFPRRMHESAGASPILSSVNVLQNRCLVGVLHTCELSDAYDCIVREIMTNNLCSGHTCHHLVPLCISDTPWSAYVHEKKSVTIFRLKTSRHGKSQCIRNVS